MNQAAHESFAGAGFEAVPGLFVASVTSVEPPGRVVVCRAGEGSVRATIAVVGEYVPRAGDAVLVAPARGGQHFVLGVVSALREVAAGVALSDGAGARTTREGGAEVLRVEDPAGRALFEYRAGDGRCRVYAPSGDLEFRAEQGSIEFVAARRVGVRAPEVQVEGTRAEVNVTDASLRAQVVSTVVERARHVAGVLETRASQLFEWARSAVREAEELAETRAAQVRLIASEVLHAHGQRTMLRADEDMKLKAEQIHLA